MRIEIGIRRAIGKKKGKIMKEKRFEGKAGLARTAHCTIGPKLRRAAFVFAVLLPLGGAMTACTPEKEPVVEMNEPIKLRISAPEGAIMPAGLEKIKLDMSQAEVLRILSPLHEVKHWSSATPDRPKGDYFTYEQDGKILYAEIMYNGTSVSEIRYGYEDSFVVY